ncbi:Zinc finger protein dzip1 [Coelomomyces lativittatus]|nr:Zinc finger protein dzip1 [Coelomomyces lativittatus]
MSKSINFVNPGFYFKRRRERINWRLLGSLDVDRIQRELDLSALQDAIDNVTFCDIESEDLRYTDPNFVKLFQLSQLIIEYLLYCQNLLQDTEKVSSKRLKELECEVEALKDQSEKQLLEIYTTKKENKSMKKTLYAYQMMSRYSGIPLSPTPPPFPLAPSNLPAFPPSVQTTNSHHRCPYCPKVFQNTPFLKAHVDRRHPEQPSRPSQNTTDDSLDYSSHLQTSSSNIQDPCLASPLKAPPTTTGSSISHEELEDEIKLRIQQQEKQQQLIERLQSTMLELEVKLSETEDQLKSDMENRLKSELDRRQRELDTTLESERASMQASLDALKNQLKTKIDHERALLETEKNTLESIRQSLLHPPPSQLGALEDDSPPPNQEELLHQFEESQARTVNAIQAFVADEIHQIRDLIHKEMEKKETQAETQFKSIQSAHFPEPSPAQGRIKKKKEYIKKRS